MFKTVGDQIFVDCYALELYLPYDYIDKEYRGHRYYTVIGTRVKFFGVGNMRFYTNEKQMSSPLTVKSHPLAVPMILSSDPSEIDVREIQLSKGGPVRKCIVLTYYKGDAFLDNTKSIKTNENVMIVLQRLEGGKFDHLPPQVANGILYDCQEMNGVKLRIPTEFEEIFVAERYRDPENPSKKVRFAKGLPTDDVYTSLNMRQDAMQATTYQAITHEDINTSLIASINRKNDGIVDEPLAMERIVRGMDISDMVAARDARLVKEQERQAPNDQEQDSEG